MYRDEYDKVKDMTYRGYCKYLQDKYGTPRNPYFTPDWQRVPGSRIPTRTKEGLYVHHIFEDCEVSMGSLGDALCCPYSWQLPENLLYCDYLEHVLLHILIAENPNPERHDGAVCGLGAIINHMAPELNDWYSGYEAPSLLAWQGRCFDKVKDCKDLYLNLLKRFSSDMKRDYDELFEDGWSPLYLCSSSHDDWDEDKNLALYKEIERL